MKIKKSSHKVSRVRHPFFPYQLKKGKLIIAHLADKEKAVALLKHLKMQEKEKVTHVGG